MLKSFVEHRVRHLLCLVAVGVLFGCSTPVLSVEDVVTFDDGSTRFVAFAERKTGWVLRGIRGVDVAFAVRDEVVATAVTDERGFAKAIAVIPAPDETFEARAEFDGDPHRSGANLVSWRRAQVIVACDIDSTISATSLGALFFDELDETSTPIEDSPRVLNALTADHQIMYVTARPRFTLEKTRAWLQEHGYPREPVITSLTVGDALAQTGYKKRTLRSLRKFYENLLIGIGNTDIDADSYGAEGMLAVLVQPEVPVSRDGHAVHLQDWDQVERFFNANREVLSDPKRVAAAARGEIELILPTPPAPDR